MYVSVISIACDHPGCDAVLGKPPKGVEVNRITGDYLSFQCREALGEAAVKARWNRPAGEWRGSGAWLCPAHAPTIDLAPAEAQKKTASGGK